ncbi:hypothetical protein B0O80DRAFT_222500 [Mortierella sp. GBAus27b]|nr:hypothetical protein BGX31_000213 [Mortierella sp. GBA43]KAI8346793.1 hypothetical protein B0O80DRAFT_222500 [Mortierella sp. GBAus27b]
MVGRSLLSVLAVAAVAIQACVASVAPDGKYNFKLGGFTLGTNDPHIGAQLILDPHSPSYGDLIVKPIGDDEVVIRLDYNDQQLWVAPLVKANHAPVELRPDPFVWRVQKHNGKYVFRRADDNQLVLAQSPTSPFLADISIFIENDVNQIWDLIPANSQEFGSNCGPRRIQRGSFYYQ